MVRHDQAIHKKSPDLSKISLSSRLKNSWRGPPSLMLASPMKHTFNILEMSNVDLEKARNTSWNKFDIRMWMRWKSSSSVAVMTQCWCCNRICLVSMTSTLSSCRAILHTIIKFDEVDEYKLWAVWTYTDSLGLPGRGANGISSSSLSDSAGVSSVVRSMRSANSLQT